MKKGLSFKCHGLDIFGLSRTEYLKKIEHHIQKQHKLWRVDSDNYVPIGDVINYVVPLKDKEGSEPIIFDDRITLSGKSLIFVREKQYIDQIWRKKNGSESNSYWIKSWL